MAETTLSAQITNLVGGTIDQDACDTWAAEACKEIINVLPSKLKAKCYGYMDDRGCERDNQYIA